MKWNYPDVESINDIKSITAMYTYNKGVDEVQTLEIKVDDNPGCIDTIETYAQHIDEVQAIVAHVPPELRESEIQILTLIPPPREELIKPFVLQYSPSDTVQYQSDLLPINITEEELKIEIEKFYLSVERIIKISTNESTTAMWEITYNETVGNIPQLYIFSTQENTKSISTTKINGSSLNVNFQLQYGNENTTTVLNAETATAYDIQLALYSLPSYHMITTVSMSRLDKFTKIWKITFDDMKLYGNIENIVLLTDNNNNNEDVNMTVCSEDSNDLLCEDINTNNGNEIGGTFDLIINDQALPNLSSKITANELEERLLSIKDDNDENKVLVGAIKVERELISREYGYKWTISYINNNNPPKLEIKSHLTGVNAKIILRNGDSENEDDRSGVLHENNNYLFGVFRIGYNGKYTDYYDLNSIDSTIQIGLRSLFQNDDIVVDSSVSKRVVNEYYVWYVTFPSEMGYIEALTIDTSLIYNGTALGISTIQNKPEKPTFDGLNTHIIMINDISLKEYRVNDLDNNIPIYFKVTFNTISGSNEYEYYLGKDRKSVV